MVDELDIADLRVHFIADYIIKSLRIRSDKWTKMVQIEEQNRTILEFCEKPHPTLLVFHVNPAGNLVKNPKQIVCFCINLFYLTDCFDVISGLIEK